MLLECAWYCKDTYATNCIINLQTINNEMIILIYLICRYIMSTNSYPPVDLKYASYTSECYLE